MEIGSVASFTVSQTPQQAPARQELPAEQRARESGNVARGSAPPPPPPARNETARGENAQQAQRPEAPKPVVNERGQKTGTIVNTTA